MILTHIEWDVLVSPAKQGIHDLHIDVQDDDTDKGMYIFHSCDESDRTAYYKRGERLYCIRDNGAWGRIQFKFYECTESGEPLCAVPMPKRERFDRVEFPGW